MDSELKQYLDEQFASIDKRFETVDSQFQTFDEKFETVATKDDLTQQLAEQTKTLKSYADEQTEKLAVIIKDTIVEPMEQNFSELKDHKTVREEVSTLKADVQKIKTALQLS